jgi:hypothetical protein
MWMVWAYIKVFIIYSSISVSHPSTGNPYAPGERLRRASLQPPLYLTSPNTPSTCQKHRSLSSRARSGTPRRTHTDTTVQSRTTAVQPRSQTSRRAASAGRRTRSSRSRRRLLRTSRVLRSLCRVLLTGRPCRMGAGTPPRPRDKSPLAGTAGGGETTGAETGAEIGRDVSRAVASPRRHRCCRRTAGARAARS